MQKCLFCIYLDLLCPPSPDLEAFTINMQSHTVCKCFGVKEICISAVIYDSLCLENDFMLMSQKNNTFIPNYISFYSKDSVKRVTRDFFVLYANLDLFSA